MSLQGPAKDAYEAARLFFANQDFASAIARFRQAYDLYADPRLLFDIAVCEKSLHHYAKTQALLRRYVALTDPRITDESRASAENALAALDRLIGRVRIEVREAGADVLIDGEYVGQTPIGPFAIDLGTHALRVEKAGFVPAALRFSTVGSEETEVVVSLDRVSHEARLVFSADTDATVSVDNRIVARGRFDGVLVAGVHELLVTASGKTPYRARLDLHDGETRVESVTLEAASRSTVWPWMAVGGALAAAGGVGLYFLLNSSAATQPPPVDHGYIRLQSATGP
jgi:hypothetical protein